MVRGWHLALVLGIGCTPTSEEPIDEREKPQAHDAQALPIPFDRCAATCNAFEACVIAGAAVESASFRQSGLSTNFDPVSCATPCPAPSDPFLGIPEFTSPCETPRAVKKRLERVADRWANNFPLVIGHRGQREFAQEHTLESLEATLELGADGNEIDLYWSTDGVPFMFHDNYVDWLIKNVGVTGSKSWADVRDAEFRNPGALGDYARTPTLFQALKSHRKFAAVFEVDYKEPRPAVSWITSVRLTERILTALKMESHRINYYDGAPVHPWDPFGSAFWDNYNMTLSAGLVGATDRTTILSTIALAQAPGGPRFVEAEDVRPVLRELGRTIRQPSCRARFPARNFTSQANESVLLQKLAACAPFTTLGSFPGCTQPGTVACSQAAAAAIEDCAYAADQLGDLASLSDDAIEALFDRAWNRSMHVNLIYHALDGATSIAASLRRGELGAVDLAKNLLQREADPSLQPIIDYQIANFPWGHAYDVSAGGLARLEYRTKRMVMLNLPLAPKEDALELVWWFLNLSKTEQDALSFPLEDDALMTLSALDHSEDTLTDLFEDGRPAYRARAILEAIDAAAAGDEWAEPLLETHAPEAIPWISAHRCREFRSPHIGWGVDDAQEAEELPQHD